MDVSEVKDRATGNMKAFNCEYKDTSRYWCLGFMEVVTMLRGISVNSNRCNNNGRISDTTEGRLLFLSGLKASLLFFLPETSSFHNSDRKTHKEID